jgi:hypothetical protein
MVSDDAERLLERAKLFDKLAADITDPRAREAAREIAQEFRVKAERLKAGAASDGAVEVSDAPGSEGGSEQGTSEGGSVIP